MTITVDAAGFDRDTRGPARTGPENKSRQRHLGNHIHHLHSSTSKYTTERDLMALVLGNANKNKQLPRSVFHDHSST